MNNFFQKQARILFIGGVALVALLFILTYVFKQNTQKSKAAGETVTLSFNPSVIPATSGDKTFVIQANSPIDIAAQGYKFDLTFDKTQVTVKDITYKFGTSSIGLGDDNMTLATVNQTGKIKIRGEIQSSTGQVITHNQNVDLVSVTFTTTTTTSSMNVMNDTTSGMYRINSDLTISALPFNNPVLWVNGSPAQLSATPAPSCTPRPACLDAKPACDIPEPGGGWCPVATPTCDPAQEGGKCLIVSPAPVKGNAILNLKLKFQGILSKPADQFNHMNVRVSIVNEQTNETIDTTGQFVADENGIWNGQVGFNLPVDPTQKLPAAIYKILVKGPKHLQKKLCVNNPSETFPGTYKCDKGTIALTVGTNNLDFSKIYQLVGDLPDQDGIVNAYDTSLVINSIGKTDDTTLLNADLNLDGVVNSQDYALVIAALSVRQDEL